MSTPAFLEWMHDYLKTEIMEEDRLLPWFKEFGSSPLNWLYLVLGCIGFFILWKILCNPRFFLRVLKTLPRDLRYKIDNKRKQICTYYMIFLLFPKLSRGLPKMIKLKRDIRRWQNGNFSISQAFDEVVKQDPRKTLLYFEDIKMTSEEVTRFLNCNLLIMKSSVEIRIGWLMQTIIGTTAKLPGCQLF